MDRYKKIKGKIKIFAGILLMVCYFLPISKCTYYEDENGNRISNEKLEEYTGEVTKTVRYGYAYDDFSVTQIGSWLDLIAFFWPIILLSFLKIILNKKIIKTICVLEILLIIFSAFWIEAIATILSSRAYGTYLAFLALAIYSVVVLIDIGINIKKRFT